jgi:hypothetical protein
MADKPKAYRVRQPRTGKDLPKTGRNTREKVTRTVALPRDDQAAASENPDILEPAPEWSVENVASEAAAVNYTPAIAETRVVPTCYPPPRGAEAAIVSALVSLAKFARRKPGTSLAAAAAAGLAVGIGLRRI